MVLLVILVMINLLVPAIVCHTINQILELIKPLNLPSQIFLVCKVKFEQDVRWFLLYFLMVFTTAFLDRGYAVIAPDGVPRQGRNGRSWRFHPNTGQQEDEIAFLKAVRDDATERFALDENNIVLAGFSIGGSMTAYTACLDPESFSAYAPVGGNFWRPHPTSCEGPVRMLHTHGWRDKTVPLEGRPLRNGAILQGDVFHAMDIWRQTNGCEGLRADRFKTDARFWQRGWDRCISGSALEFVLHTGSHGVPKGWADKALDWFDVVVPPTTH